MSAFDVLAISAVLELMPLSDPPSKVVTASDWASVISAMTSQISVSTVVGEDANDSGNTNLRSHRRNDGSPIFSGNDRGRRVRQGNKLQDGGNSQNIKRRHKKHLT